MQPVSATQIITNIKQQAIRILADTDQYVLGAFLEIFNDSLPPERWLNGDQLEKAIYKELYKILALRFAEATTKG